MVQGWSARSRSRMVRTYASLDYGPIDLSGRVPAMVTLTLPGDWLTVAPDAARFHALVKAFRKRWLRRWGEPLIGLWKLEFQRRGAPHLHIWTARPRGPVWPPGFRRHGLVWWRILTPRSDGRTSGLVPVLTPGQDSERLTRADSPCTFPSTAPTATRPIRTRPLPSERGPRDASGATGGCPRPPLRYR